MSKELIYYVTDDILARLSENNVSGFDVNKNICYKNEICITIPNKKVKKYLVLYINDKNEFKISGFRWKSLEFFNENHPLLKPIQLIQESMIETECED